MLDQVESELRSQEDRENAAAYKEANAISYAAGVAQEIIAGDPVRREQYVEHLLDHDDELDRLLCDLLDDVGAGINPTETLKRSIQDRSISIAVEEEEWH